LGIGRYVPANNRPGLSGLEIKMVLKLPAALTGSFRYVDCGARGDVSKSVVDLFGDSRYIGFDPQLSAVSEQDASRVYFPVALGKETGPVEFYRTQSPNCSSVFIPDQEFLDRFMSVGNFFKIVETVPLNVVSLDDYLPKNGITRVDFIELDTQGSELDILQGAKSFLGSSVLGVRIEVEFTTMYQNQPLFGDVDSFLRQYGFALFDLDRYHLRRKAGPMATGSKEQIIWGQALYFKDWKNTSETFTKQEFGKLAMIASFYGFHTYASEILEYMLSDHVSVLSEMERDQLAEIYHHGTPFWEVSLRDRLVIFLKRIPRRIQSLFKLMKNMFAASQADNYFWKD
jgi:FkbM family methyltransferase